MNKTRLENEIDSLPEDTRFRERKLHDMTLRLDGLYDVIVELEEKIEDVKLRRKAVEQDAITLENIYTLLANFEKVYDKISDEEKKSLISSLIKEIEIFPCDESELPLKSILFNFPVYKDGGDVYEFLWDKSTHVSPEYSVAFPASRVAGRVFPVRHGVDLLSGYVAALERERGAYESWTREDRDELLMDWPMLRAAYGDDEGDTRTILRIDQDARQ